jgi:hypothetical protein
LLSGAGRFAIALPPSSVCDALLRVCWYLAPARCDEDRDSFLHKRGVLKIKESENHRDRLA